MSNAVTDLEQRIKNLQQYILNEKNANNPSQQYIKDCERTISVLTKSLSDLKANPHYMKI